MTEKCFVDTNVFVYARDKSADHKRQIAIELIASLWTDSRLVISSQVITELCSVLSSKYNVGDVIVAAEARRLLAIGPVPIDEAVIQQGLSLRAQYRLSWWDAWIVAAALVAGCSTLYSEDLAHGASYHGVVVCDPFR